MRIPFYRFCFLVFCLVLDRNNNSVVNNLSNMIFQYFCVSLPYSTPLSAMKLGHQVGIRPSITLEVYRPCLTNHHDITSTHRKTYIPHVPFPADPDQSRQCLTITDIHNLIATLLQRLPNHTSRRTEPRSTLPINDRRQKLTRPSYLTHWMEMEDPILRYRNLKHQMKIKIYNVAPPSHLVRLSGHAWMARLLVQYVPPYLYNFIYCIYSAGIPL
ncbi:hypothetical protein B0H65DRAFT_461350 [Neurospora tetraspora]|uniref:Uncharacterized protein n=1 Tax=Neurospora tetraspora TaxID=94610 RepID=A0AAE0JHH3_9PEZI|nr:hypothetical protein B0H65DRAFT_461350 [Neurospora tetraspora]